HGLDRPWVRRRAEGPDGFFCQGDRRAPGRGDGMELNDPAVDPDLVRLIGEVWGGLDGVDVRLERTRATQRQRSDTSRIVESYRVLPGPRRARFLLPDEPVVAASALRSYNALRPPAVARRRALTASFVRGPALVGRSRLIVEADGGSRTVAKLLSELTGEDIVLAIGVGHQGPNRKPVFQVFDRAGKAVAFAKLGSNPHTDGLVRNESRALALVEQNPVPGLSSP